MAYFAPTLTCYLHGTTWDAIRGEVVQFCQSILREYGRAPLRETAEIVFAMHAENQKIGSVAALSSQNAAAFESPSFRRVHWRIEWPVGTSCQMDIIPKFGTAPSVSVKFDPFDETAPESAESDFEAVARGVVERNDRCVFETLDASHGAPAAIYYHGLHSRKRFAESAANLPPLTAFESRFLALLPSAPRRLSLPASKIERWLIETETHLKAQHGVAS